MPRITLLKIALSPLAAFLSLIVLWFTLPFPTTVTPLFRLRYIENVLQSGSRITTVHTPGSSFANNNEAITFVPSSFSVDIWNAVIISWQLRYDFHTNAVLLNIGNKASLNSGASVNLTSLATQSPGFPEGAVNLLLPAGDQDGICPPYFDYADATWLYHQAIDSWQAVSLRLLVPQVGMIQVWKDMEGWENFNASHLAMIDDEDRRRGLLATFDLSGISAPSAIPLRNVKVSHLDGLLPTRTFAVRWFILAILKPVATYTIAAIGFSEPILLIVGKLLTYFLLTTWLYFLTSVTCWFLSGRRRPFLRWARDFWLTRGVHRIVLGPPPPEIWTASGPMPYDDEEKGQVSIAEERVKPLTGLVSFFTSSSPLDSLLVSFESTRWMAQPRPRS